MLAPIVGVTVVDRERKITRLVPPLAQRHELVRPVVNKRRKQDTVDDRENGGRRADGQREREDVRERVGAVVPEAAQCVAEGEGHKLHGHFDEATVARVGAAITPVFDRDRRVTPA